MTEVLGEHYEVNEELVRDDMARVVAATDTRSGAGVTIVIVDARVTPREDLIEGCFQEARTAAESSPNLALGVIETGRTDRGEAYIVHESTQGWTNLAVIMSKRGALPIHESAQLGRRLCQFFVSIHSKGQVHGALRPECIFLSTNDEGELCLKVAGFGLGLFHDPSIGRGQALAAKPGYLSDPTYRAPEQLSSSRGMSFKADLYATGVILYTALTGRRPFRGRTFGELVVAVATAVPSPMKEACPTMPLKLEEAVARAMAREPRARFASAAAFAAAVEPYTTAPSCGESETSVVDEEKKETIEEEPPGASAPLERAWDERDSWAAPQKSNTKLYVIAAAASLVVLLLIVGVVVAIQSRRQPAVVARPVVEATEAEPEERSNQQIAEQALSLAESSPARALTLAKRAARRDPALSTAWFVIAFVEGQRGNDQEAAEAIERCIAASGPHTLACRTLSTGGGTP